MRKTIIILSAFALIMGSCGQTTKKQAANNENISPTDTTETVISDINNIDSLISLKHAKILKEALNIATQNIDKDTFHLEYVRVVDVGYFDVQVEINLVYHFTKNYPHLNRGRYEKYK